jgi:hypothetical protein
MTNTKRAIKCAALALTLGIGISLAAPAAEAQTCEYDYVIGTSCQGGELYYLWELTAGPAGCPATNEDTFHEKCSQ